MPEVHNPNLQSQGPGGGSGGSGGDMRSMLVMMMLVVLVFLGYEYFRPKPAEPTPTANQQTQTQPTQSASQAPASTVPSAATSSNPAPASKSGSPPTPAQPEITAASELQTVIENEWFRITFSNRGGEVKSWILKHYYDTGGIKGGHNLDMVQQQTAARFGFPLALFTYDDALTSQLKQALYQVKVEGSTTPSGSYLAPATLTFHYAQNGVDVVKIVRFDSSYVVSVETQVKRNGEPVRALVSWPAGLGDMEEFLPSNAPASATRSPVPTSASSQIIWSIDGKQTMQGPVAGGFLIWSQPGVSNEATFDQPFQYAALTDLYFAAAFLPDDPGRATLVTLHNSIDLPTNLSDPTSQKRPTHLLGFAVGDTSGDTRLRLYAGPKALDTLASIHAIGADGQPTGPSLKPLIQFGWFTIIAEPLYLGLRFLNEHVVSNWGWDIIIMTAIFNLAMLPTRLMAMKSGLKMQRLAPQVNAIKRKYSSLKMNDPKRAEMNTEMMDLYRREGVNMYGSCLPMLPQIPLFFAYYRVLANVIELRQAHWFWLHDLSVSDPYYILPIIILVSMFIVQFITPSPGMDPMQRKMMAIMMPVIFGYSMSHFASGLALYWCTGNLINLGMQIAINRSSIGREMHDLAAKRANKKNGGPTIKGKR